MTPGASDEQVMRLVSASRIWFAAASMLGWWEAAWRHSATARVAAVVGATGDPVVANRLRARAWLVLWAAIVAIALSFMGTRRDGLNWVVPAAAGLAAALVIAMAPSSRTTPR